MATLLCVSLIHDIGSIISLTIPPKQPLSLHPNTSLSLSYHTQLSLLLTHTHTYCPLFSNQTGAAVGRAMTANATSTTSNNNNMFAAYAMREKQVRMQLQGATIVSLPPTAGSDMGLMGPGHHPHPFPDGGMYGDDSGDDRVYPQGDRPRTTGNK